MDISNIKTLEDLILVVQQIHDEIHDGPRVSDEIGIIRKIERLRCDLYFNVSPRVSSLEHKLDKSTYKSARLARKLGVKELNRQLNRKVYEATTRSS